MFAQSPNILDLPTPADEWLTEFTYPLATTPKKNNYLNSGSLERHNVQYNSLKAATDSFKPKEKQSESETKRESFMQNYNLSYTFTPRTPQTVSSPKDKQVGNLGNFIPPNNCGLYTPGVNISGISVPTYTFPFASNLQNKPVSGLVSNQLFDTNLFSPLGTNTGNLNTNIGYGQYTSLGNPSSQVKEEGDLHSRIHTQNPSSSFKVNNLMLKLGQRVNSWTRQEEAFLIGVVVAKYLTQGTLFASEASKKKRKFDKISSDSQTSVVEDCWNSIKIAFDQVWKKYSQQTGNFRPCDRTANALGRHYKVMKTKLKSGEQEDFHVLYNLWKNDYNAKHNLLNPDFFAILDHNKSVREKEQNSAKRQHLSPAPMSEGIEERIGDSIHIRTQSNISTFTNMTSHTERSSLSEAAYSYSPNSWEMSEEVILVGIVVDRFIKRGSLVSPRSKKSIDKDCWSSIKRKFDVAWRRYTNSQGIQINSERSLNSLSRHYKVIRQRTTAQTRRMISRHADVEGIDGVLEPMTLLRSMNEVSPRSLWQLYDQWVNIFNKGQCLLGLNENVEAL